MAACGVGAAAMSCASPRSADAVFSPEGHWLVVAIQGLDGRPEAEHQPFIDFRADGQVSGNAGCNRLMGAYVADTLKQTLSLDQLGSTRMMCRDMKTEDALLAALGKVKAYRSDNGQLVLVDEEGSPLVTLKKSETDK